MFVWAPLPEPYEEMGSLEFAKMLVQEAKVAVSPGVGFGPGGEGFVRFALVENEQRIGQAAPRDPQGPHQARLTAVPADRRTGASALASEAAEAERDRGVGDLVDRARRARRGSAWASRSVTPTTASASTSRVLVRDRGPRRCRP